MDLMMVLGRQMPPSQFEGDSALQKAIQHALLLCICQNTLFDVQKWIMGFTRSQLNAGKRLDPQVCDWTQQLGSKRNGADKLLEVPVGNIAIAK
jgi:hypothetical protein